MVKVSIQSISITLICLSQVFSEKIDFTTPNKPLENSPGYGKKVGNIDDYLEYLKQTNDSKFPKVGGDERTVVGNEANAKYFIRHAGASYCSDASLQAWNCKHCNALSGARLVKVFSEAKYESRGIVTLNTNRREIVVSFRGTSNTANWIENLKFDKTTFAGAGSGAEVHIGFKNVADALQPQYNQAVKELLSQSAYSSYNVIVTGHSLGGAVATLAATYIQQANNLPWSRLQLYTYEQPRVGNPVFANWYNKLPFSATRVTNENDMVPHVPPMNFNYQHQHTEVYVKDNKSNFCATNQVEDPNCSNSRVPWLSTSPHSNVWGISLGGDGC